MKKVKCQVKSDYHAIALHHNITRLNFLGIISYFEFVLLVPNNLQGVGYGPGEIYTHAAPGEIYMGTPISRHLLMTTVPTDAFSANLARPNLPA
jgi:hypothetical protein